MSMDFLLRSLIGSGETLTPPLHYRLWSNPKAWNAPSVSCHTCPSHQPAIPLNLEQTPHTKPSSSTSSPLQKSSNPAINSHLLSALSTVDQKFILFKYPSTVHSDPVTKHREHVGKSLSIPNPVENGLLYEYLALTSWSLFFLIRLLGCNLQ